MVPVTLDRFLPAADGVAAVTLLASTSRLADTGLVANDWCVRGRILAKPSNEAACRILRRGRAALPCSRTVIKKDEGDGRLAGLTEGRSVVFWVMKSLRVQTFD